MNDVYGGDSQRNEIQMQTNPIHRKTAGAAFQDRLSAAKNSSKRGALLKQASSKTDLLVKEIETEETDEEVAIRMFFGSVTAVKILRMCGVPPKGVRTILPRNTVADLIDLPAAYMWAIFALNICAFLALYLYYFITIFQKHTTDTFISLKSDAGVCSEVPISITGEYLGDSKGLWSTSPGFSFNHNAYQVTMFGMSYTTSDWKKIIADVTAQVQEIGVKTSHRDLAFNQMALSSYVSTYNDDKTGLKNSGLLQFYSAADAKYIYNKEIFAAGFASRNGTCRAASTATFNEATAKVTITADLTGGDNGGTCEAPCEDNPCPGILGPFAMGYSKYASTSVLDVVVDMQSYTTAIAINVGIKKLSELTRVEGDPARVALLSSMVRYGFLSSQDNDAMSTYYDALYSPMEPVYCIEFADVYNVTQCFLRIGNTLAYPYTKHWGDFGNGSAECTEDSMGSGTANYWCNQFDVMASLVYFPVDNTAYERYQTFSPTSAPTLSPGSPTLAPVKPVAAVTATPVTASPSYSRYPSTKPTVAPVHTKKPSHAPTLTPTIKPVSYTLGPSKVPTLAPSPLPTRQPTTSMPTPIPTPLPTSAQVTHVITTVAGTGDYGDISGSEGTSTKLSYPFAAVRDTGNNLYISDTYNHLVRKLNLTTNAIVDFAGTGQDGFSGDLGKATNAELSEPKGLVLSSIVNRDYFCYSDGDGSAATSANIGDIFQIALDTQGNLYLPEPYSYKVRKITVSTSIITTFAGTGFYGYMGDGDPATSAELSCPYGVAVGGNFLYIADTNNHVIRSVHLSTDIIQTFAGTGFQGNSGNGFSRTSADLYYPKSLSYQIGGADIGSLFIAQTDSSNIRKIDSAGIISAFAGSYTVASTDDSTDDNGGYYDDDADDGIGASLASLSYPDGVFADSSGDVFIADTFHNTVRRVTRTGTYGPTLAPTPQVGHPTYSPFSYDFYFYYDDNSGGGDDDYARATVDDDYVPDFEQTSFPVVDNGLIINFAREIAKMTVYGFPDVDDKDITAKSFAASHATLLTQPAYNVSYSKEAYEAAFNLLCDGCAMLAMEFFGGDNKVVSKYFYVPDVRPAFKDVFYKKKAFEGFVTPPTRLTQLYYSCVESPATAFTAALGLAYGNTTANMVVLLLLFVTITVQVLNRLKLVATPIRSLPEKDAEEEKVKEQRERQLIELIAKFEALVEDAKAGNLNAPSLLQSHTKIEMAKEDRDQRHFEISQKIGVVVPKEASELDSDNKFAVLNKA